MILVNNRCIMLLTCSFSGMKRLSLQKYGGLTAHELRHPYRGAAEVRLETDWKVV